MISNHLVSDDHLFAKSIKLQREQTKLTSHILIIHVTNTNEEINSHLSSPLIYKINSYYKYEKIPYPSTSIHEANFFFFFWLPRSWHYFPIRSPSKRTVASFCLQGRARIFRMVPAYSTVWLKGGRFRTYWTRRYTGDRIWKWRTRTVAKL